MQSWTAIVADRDRKSAAQIEKVLTSLRYDVVALADPQQVSAAAQKYPRALVLVAPSPGSSPLQLCQQLRSVPGRKYIILLLDGYRTESVSTAFEAGADDAIAKPLIGAELAARLRNARQILGLEDFRRDFEDEGTLFAEIAARSSFHSRRYLHAQLGHEISRASRFAHALSVVLAEVRFMAADDRFMRAFGRLLSEHLRSQVDWIARDSERRFALVLPETGLAGAQCAAERLRSRLHNGSLDSTVAPNGIIVNFGVCACNADELSTPGKPDTQVLLDSAEAYLRDATHIGPNQIAGGHLRRTDSAAMQSRSRAT